MKRRLPLLVDVFSFIAFFVYTVVFAVVILYLIRRAGFPFTVESVFGSADPVRALLLREPVFDGLFPAISGTFLLVVISVGIAVPVGIGTGVWLSEYAKGALYHVMTLFLDILAGLPSIVIGLFGFSFILLCHRLFPGKGPGFSIIVSGASLSVLVLPYLARSTEAALQSLDNSVKTAALSLGASRMENIRYVLLPKASPSILSGILLSIARCAEDTAVIMLTGAVASAGVPSGVFQRFEALPFYIFYTSSQYTCPSELDRAFDASVILIFLSTVLFGVSLVLNKTVSDPATEGK
ncbi:MAG: ABC transporter permease subunit [Desulfobacteraceae bacterium]